MDVTVNEEGRWVMEGMLLVPGEGLMAPGQIIGLCGCTRGGVCVAYRQLCVHMHVGGRRRA